MSLLRVVFLCIVFYSCSYGQTEYEIVIKNGRVIDPETELDAVKYVGVSNGQIMDISDQPLAGKRVIDAAGHVVAPGFIDLHVHGMTDQAHRYQARDGVTTALELEGGRIFLRKWLASKEGKSLVNYGATVSHGDIRSRAMQSYSHYYDKMEEVIDQEGFDSPQLDKLAINVMRSGYQKLESGEIQKMKDLVVMDLNAGALGIGVPVGYYTAASNEEIYSIYKVAAEKNVPVFSHTRGFGLPGIHEAIANATSSGAPLHIVHANSLSLSEIQVTLDMVADAQDRGLDVTTEIYPYTAASTALESELFDEGWKDDLSITYEDLQWEATGERLTKETFYTYREKGGTVIIHMMKPEWILKGIKDDRTMIASDGMPYNPGAHPRSAGTFSRVLGKYVREEKAIDLMTALKKMTIYPAKRMEIVSPMMARKGRLQVGADADIVIFDPATVKDKADFKGLKYSEGIPYVLVNGELVVDNNEVVEGVYPGKPIIGKYRK